MNDNILLGSPTRRRERRLSSEIDTVRPASIGEEELQLQLALAMSREEHEEQVRQMKSDDIKLQMAIDESRKVQEEVGLLFMTTAFKIELYV